MGSALKWVISAFFGALNFALPEILRRLFAFLGVGLTTYTGLNYVEQLLIDEFKVQLAGLPITIIDFLGMFRIDDAFSLLISAWVVRRVMDGWQSGSRSIFSRNTTGTSTDPWSAPRSGGWF